MGAAAGVQAAGVWTGWDRAALDSTPVPAERAGGATGPNPKDRGKSGMKRDPVTDADPRLYAPPIGAISGNTAQSSAGLVCSASTGRVSPVSTRVRVASLRA